MDTLDLEVIGFEEGSGRLAGTLGAILVRYKEGNVVKVGSGSSDSMRSEIWANQSDWLGSICEIQYFEETTGIDEIVKYLLIWSNAAVVPPRRALTIPAVGL